MPRIADQNCEVWLLRVYYPTHLVFCTFGFFLIPREHLYHPRKEQNCLVALIQAVDKILGKKFMKRVFLSSKRNMHFVARFGRALQCVRPGT